jgi:hypothetical protein
MESALKLFGVGVSLLAGWLFIRFSPYRAYRAEHLRSDRFALHVLGFSISFYIFGVLITAFIENYWPYGHVDSFLDLVARISGLDAPVVCAFFSAPAFALIDRLYIFCKMRNDLAVKQHAAKSWKVRSRVAAVALFILECDEDSIRILHRATIYRMPIMVTLKSGKVYVGEPVRQIRDPSIMAKSIKLIPLYSGYRDANTHKVELPTDYKKLRAMLRLRDSAEPANADDPLAEDFADLEIQPGQVVPFDMQNMGVVIFWEDIQSLSLYDENIYRAFQAMGPPKKQSNFFGKDGLLSRLLS